MLVHAIMTSPAIVVHPETSIAEAAKTMLDNHISGLPVVDASAKLVGIVSEGDFIRRSELNTERKRSWLLELLTCPARAPLPFRKKRLRRSSGSLLTCSMV